MEDIGTKQGITCAKIQTETEMDILNETEFDILLVKLDLYNWCIMELFTVLFSSNVV